MIPIVSTSHHVAIPVVGLGVYRTGRGEETRSTVQTALQLGHRHIDTAMAYGNEADVGAALAGSGIARSEIFVTTKLWNADQGYDSALRAFEESRKRLGVEQIDLYLLHWPVPSLRLESWRALVQLYRDGRVRAIGVSNFMVPHIEELAARSEMLPHVNQIEVSPFHQQRDVRAWCAERGILVEAYSPLTKGMKLHHPEILSIAARHGRSPAQVLLRWGIEQGMIVLPKSVRAERMTENAALFDFTLDVDAHKVLATLDEGLATGWDPRGQP